MSTAFRDQAACIACRIALAYVIGEVLIGRVEISTPLHSLISIREGLFWKQVGRSPYTASVFRGPPLLLQLCQLTAKRLVWQASVLSLVDWITSCVLERVVTHAIRLSKQDNAGTLASSTTPCAVLNRVATVLCNEVSAHCRTHLHQTVSQIPVPRQPLPDHEHCSRVHCHSGKPVRHHSAVWGLV